MWRSTALARVQNEEDPGLVFRAGLTQGSTIPPIRISFSRDAIDLKFTECLNSKKPQRAAENILTVCGL